MDPIFKKTHHRLIQHVILWIHFVLGKKNLGKVHLFETNKKISLNNTTPVVV